MAEKITKVWLKGLLAAAQTIATKFSLETVAENLSQTISDLDAVNVVEISNFNTFSEAMNAFGADEYLSHTDNDKYDEEAKKIKYTVFSGKKGDLISVSIKQKLDAAANSWSNIKCVYSYTCQQGLCPNDKVICTQQVDCSNGTCKQGYVSCSYGSCNNSYYEVIRCSIDSTNTGGCQPYTYTKEVACSANGPCAQTKWCNGHQAASSRTCSNKRTVEIKQSCEHETCSQGTLYDIRCEKKIEAQE